ncbi:MAG: type II toxin-antitoxin system VapC family toxin [Candidatus Rokuibacteriota bacterium]
MILLDTSVLSLVLRRRGRGQPEPEVVEVVRRMIREDVPMAVPGIVLQEVLSGVRTEAQFVRLKHLLEAFPILVAERHHHVGAARIANACRRKGLATSAVDCLVSALATERDASLFTVDEDFFRMAPHCGLKLLGVDNLRDVE